MSGGHHRVSTSRAGRVRARLSRAVATPVEQVADVVRTRHDRMVATAAEKRLGTRRRTVGPLVAGFASLGLLFGLVSSNVLALGFTSGSNTYKVYTDRVYGQKGGLYIDEQTRALAAGGTDKKGVTHVGFKEAKLYGLCALVQHTVPVVGTKYTLRLTGGEAPVDGTYAPDLTNPTLTSPPVPAVTEDDWVSANNLYLKAPVLRGYGNNIASMSLGISANQLGVDSNNNQDFTGGAGNFGMKAEVMDITNLEGDTYGIDLQGTIKLPNLRIEVLDGHWTKGGGPTDTTPNDYQGCAS